MTKKVSKKVQEVLGVDQDGILGPATLAALKAFQKSKGLTPDGIVGPNTLKAMGITSSRDRSTVVSTKNKEQLKTPRQKDVVAVYGPAGGPACTAGIIIFPYAMKYGGKIVKSTRCHKLLEDKFNRIFKRVWDHYGEDVYRLGLDQYGGCFNYRPMRNGNRLSMHSWGIAFDIDPANNQLKWGRNKARLAKPEYEAFWKIVEEEGATSLGRERNFDWMHFQFARL